MKTMWFAVCTLVLAFALVGCSGEPAALGPDDDGTTVDVAVGESVTIELPANITTGYSWAITEPGPFDDSAGPEYIPDEHLKNTVGAGGVDRFVLTRESASAGTLVLEYRRSWESSETPAEDTWSIDVSSAGE